MWSLIKLDTRTRWGIGVLVCLVFLFGAAVFVGRNLEKRSDEIPGAENTSDSQKDFQSDTRPRIIYRENKFGLDGGYVGSAYHVRGLDGTGDRVIYSTRIGLAAADDSSLETALVFGNRALSIGRSLVDKDGNDLTGKYAGSGINIGPSAPVSPSYSPDGKRMAADGQGAEIHVFDFQTQRSRGYSCAECEHYPSYHVLGFSSDGKRLYIELNRDVPLYRLDTQPDQAWFALDLEQGVLTAIPLRAAPNTTYMIYPQYDVVLREACGKVPTTCSLEEIDLGDYSVKRMVTRANDGNFLFNGTVLLYPSVWPGGTEGVKSFNLSEGVSRDILPVALVNTFQDGQKDLLDFLPGGNRFLYQVQYGSGWEVRWHDVDTGEDRSIANLTAECAADGSYSFRSYVGVIF